MERCETAKLYKAKGEIVDIKPKGKKFTLQELYQLLDCKLIEVVTLKHNMIMIVDEEGKIKRNPTLNLEATKIFKEVHPHNDFIVGDAIICPKKMF